jgi:Rps23 Pro-64 3,4-dihydroxylase Tpa1-like proline 4-hydroxylase
VQIATIHKFKVKHKMSSANKRKKTNSSSAKRSKSQQNRQTLDDDRPSCNLTPEVQTQTDQLTDSYQRGVSNETLQVITDPFKCAIIDRFVKEGDDFLIPLQREIERNVKLFELNNDLYRFKQSRDLKHLNRLTHCQALRQCLLEQMLPILANCSDIELFDDQIDLTVSKYERNDVLLCHDDMLEERRIAFILYLVPDEWSEQDGGELLLFSRDGTNHAHI